MFYLDGGNIYIHRGDSASFDIVFGDVDESEYDRNTVIAKDVYGIDWIPEDGTPIRFTVKCDCGRMRPVIQKDYVIWNGFVCIDLPTKDTRCLPYGTYQWDVRISFSDADTIDWNTPLNSFDFTVCEVVGDV